MKHTLQRPRRVVPFVALSVAGAFALTSCASANESSTGTGSESLSASDSGLPQDLIDAAVAAAETAANGEDLSGTLDIVGIASGADGDIFTAAMAPFEQATGVTINYTGTGDLSTVVAAGVEAGNAPDIVDGQGLGLMLQYARSGDALSLSDAIGDDVLADNFNPGLLNSATVDGEVYGIWNEADTFQVFYNPATYDGPTDGSWDDLMAWSATEAADGDGTAPWCVGLEAGAGSGFPAQGFLETLFVQEYGSDALAEWADATLPWTSDEVKSAFEKFGAVATTDFVNGGAQGSVSSSAFTFMDGMYSDPQLCQLTLWGNYAAGIVAGSNPQATIPDGLDFFPVPATTPEFQNALDVAGHVTFALNDDPASVAFMKYWATPEAQSLIAASGQYTVANINVPLDVYPSEAMKGFAQQLLDATTVTPGPASAVPTAVNAAYLTGIMAYVQDPASLDSILATIQASTE